MLLRINAACLALWPENFQAAWAANDRIVVNTNLIRVIRTSRGHPLSAVSGLWSSVSP